MVGPDFAGFAEAQGRLRDSFGKEITFYLPSPDAVTYPPGTQLDPETQRPYDPTIEPLTGGGEVTTAVQCNVVSRPMGLSQRGIEGSVERDAIGWVESGGVVLIVRIEDRDTVKDATHFDYEGEKYTIRQSDNDSLGPVERYLIWGKQGSQG